MPKAPEAVYLYLALIHSDFMLCYLAMIFSVQQYLQNIYAQPVFHFCGCLLFRHKIPPVIWLLYVLPQKWEIVKLYFAER